jgi:hypothetical protein
MPRRSWPRFANRGTRLTFRAIIWLLNRSMWLLIRLIGRNGDVSALLPWGMDVRSVHAALREEERPLRLRIATTLPRLLRALVLRRDEVERPVLRDEVLRAFARREV